MLSSLLSWEVSVWRAYQILPLPVELPLSTMAALVAAMVLLGMTMVRMGPSHREAQWGWLVLHPTVAHTASTIGCSTFWYARAERRYRNRF